MRICDLRTGSPKKFAVLRNEPKNLQIRYLRNFKKVCLPASESVQSYKNLCLVLVRPLSRGLTKQ
jgi:hypothetical protein